jgi:GTPase SAR1 family protein
LDFWYDSIRKSTNDDIVIFLIGNKIDLLNPGESIQTKSISRERALEFSKRYNLQGWGECSAKENLNIKETFVSFYKCSKFYNLIAVYNKQKGKLEEKTKEMKKLLEGKKKDPKVKCC